MKVILAPGAFDDVPEEDQEGLFKKIQEMVDNGTLFDNSESIDMDTLKEEDPEMYDSIMNAEIPTLQ